MPHDKPSPTFFIWQWKLSGQNILHEWMHERSSRIFAARCYASAAYAVMRCVCLSCSYILSKWITYIQIFFTIGKLHHSSFFPRQTTHGNPPNRGVECRWSRQKSRFWANIWLYCMLWGVPAASAIHSAVTNHAEFITLVAGKRPSLLTVVNNDEVYEGHSKSS